MIERRQRSNADETLGADLEDRNAQFIMSVEPVSPLGHADLGPRTRSAILAIAEPTLLLLALALWAFGWRGWECRRV